MIISDYRKKTRRSRMSKIRLFWLELLYNFFALFVFEQFFCNSQFFLHCIVLELCNFLHCALEQFSLLDFGLFALKSQSKTLRLTYPLWGRIASSAQHRCFSKNSWKGKASHSIQLSLAGRRGGAENRNEKPYFGFLIRQLSNSNGEFKYSE